VNTGDARAEILRSIRTHLEASKRHDAVPSASDSAVDSNHEASLPLSRQSLSETAVAEVIQVFKRNLEAVDGQCVVVHSDAEVEETVKRITEGREVATPNASRSDLFKYEVGVTAAQAGIAETGTLVLDSSVERNRLVSLVPPVHIAILDASRIYPTLSETLNALHSGAELSPAITFITGPSRTADIELTLAIGVHGPQELHVIVVQNKS